MKECFVTAEHFALDRSRTDSTRVAAIVVTRNRIELLKECINSIKRQSRTLDEIIVIDNGSDDGTQAWLSNQHGLTVIRQVNTGSSGGQFTGIKTAFANGHDWFWCMDDDTIPRPDALERLLESPPAKQGTASFLSSLVVWTDDTPHRANLAPISTNYETWHHRVLTDKVLPVTSATFVSLAISRHAVAKQGLPYHDFFIWYDDVEYTQRLRRFKPGWLVLESVAIHKTETNTPVAISGKLPGRMVEKYCYGIRNHMFTLRTSAQSGYLRLRLCESLIRRHFIRFLRREVPFKVVWWCLKGLWFAPTIEFPNGCQTSDCDLPLKK